MKDNQELYNDLLKVYSIKFDIPIGYITSRMLAEWITRTVEEANRNQERVYDGINNIQSL